MQGITQQNHIRQKYQENKVPVSELWWEILLDHQKHSNILAQINVNVFISRDKSFWVSMSIFKAVTDTLRTVFFLAFSERKIYRGMASSTFFPVPCLREPVRNPHKLLWPSDQCLLPVLQLLASSSRDVTWAEYSAWGIPTYCTVHYCERWFSLFMWLFLNT